MSQLRLHLGILALVAICIPYSSAAQTRSTILVLPFNPTGVDTASARMVASLVRAELERNSNNDVIETGKTPDVACEDVACAVEAARLTPASKVVYGSLGRLGDKYVVSYSIGEVATGRRVKSGDRAAWSVEELENAARFISGEISGGSSTPDDSRAIAPRSNVVMNRRYDTMAISVGFGQMYPTSGYEGTERAFVFDTRVSLEKPHYSFDMLLAWRLGPLINLGATYMFTRESISPYVGGGFGYHLTSGQSEPDTNNYYDGPELPSGSFQLMARVGTWVLRTSSIRFYVNIDYLLNLEGGKQKAVSLTLGMAGVTDQLRLF